MFKNHFKISGGGFLVFPGRQKLQLRFRRPPQYMMQHYTCFFDTVYLEIYEAFIARIIWRRYIFYTTATTHITTKFSTGFCYI